MVRPKRGGAGMIAGVVAATAACTLVVVLIVALFADRFLASPLVSVDARNVASGASTFERVDREHKTDALPVPPTTQARTEIKSVEVVGIRNAAIIYRDRAGNILFRTDPVANVTVVAKNVDLPEVTIRDTVATEVDRMVVEQSEPAVPPQGCESSFARPSPVALTRISSRCLAEAGAPAKFAALQ